MPEKGISGALVANVLMLTLPKAEHAKARQREQCLAHLVILTMRLLLVSAM